MTRLEASSVALSALAAQGLLFAALSGCDAIDVTSDAQPPSAQCASCHLPEFRTATHPPHEGVKPTTCGTCHGQDSFHPSRIEHSFPLDGAHANANCFACHAGAPPAFEGTPRACSVCHSAEKARADAAILNHSGFTESCDTCHGTNAWRPTLHESAPVARAPSTSPSPPTPATPKPSPAPRPGSGRGGSRPSPDTVSGASRSHGR